MITIDAVLKMKIWFCLLVLIVNLCDLEKNCLVTMTKTTLRLQNYKKSEEMQQHSSVDAIFIIILF